METRDMEKLKASPAFQLKIQMETLRMSLKHRPISFLLIVDTWAFRSWIMGKVWMASVNDQWSWGEKSNAILWKCVLGMEADIW